MWHIFEETALSSPENCCNATGKMLSWYPSTRDLKITDRLLYHFKRRRSWEGRVEENSWLLIENMSRSFILNGFFN